MGSVTLDFSKAQPLHNGVKLDFSKAQPVANQGDPNSFLGGALRHAGDIAKSTFGLVKPSQNKEESAVEAAGGPGALVLERLGKGAYESTKTGLEQAKQQWNDAGSIPSGNRTLKGLEYVRAITTALGSVDPLTSGATVNINQLADQGRMKEAAGSGTVDSLLLASGTKVGGEAIGAIPSRVLEKMGRKALPKMYNSVNNYIGLAKTDLPKMGRTVQNAQDIAHTVVTEAGIRKTLAGQRDAIEAARGAHEAATEKIVSVPGSRVTDVHSLAIDRAVRLLDELEREGVPHEQIRAIDKNLEGITQSQKTMMNPKEMHEMRKSLQKQITDWNPDTKNVRQRYLQGLYHDLNDAISRALPPKEARGFRAHNRVQNRLITAREAANDKLLSENLKSSPGLATTAARIATGGAVGGLLGARYGRVGEGALAGGLFGAGAEAARTIELPSLDARSARLISRAAPKLAKAAKKSPRIAALLEAAQTNQANSQ